MDPCFACKGAGWLKSEVLGTIYCDCTAGRKLRMKREEETPIPPPVMPKILVTFIF